MRGLPEAAPAFVQCALRHRAGSLQLDVAFVARSPWTILFGPSGSGKSTVLRLLAGLLRPDAGAVAVLGHPVSQSANRFFLPPYLRPVRWSGQKTALFPRMTVRENLAFGSGDSAEHEDALVHFGLQGLAGKRPAELSGGEQQRVAVVRAASAARGRLLLLDEPFTGLDARVRNELIAHLQAWMGTSPVLSVTHDVAEAFQLGAEVVRLEAGRVVAQGAAREVLAADRARMLKVLA